MLEDKYITPQNGEINLLLQKSQKIQLTGLPLHQKLPRVKINNAKKKKKSTAGTTQQCDGNTASSKNCSADQGPDQGSAAAWVGRSVVQRDRKDAPVSRSRAGFQLGHCCRGAQPFLEVVCAYVCCISQCSHTLWVSCDSTLAQQRGYIVLLPQHHRGSACTVDDECIWSPRVIQTHGRDAPLASRHWAERDQKYLPPEGNDYRLLG